MHLKDMDEAPRLKSVAGPSTSALRQQSNLVPVSKRKFSFPAALHSTLLGLHDPARENHQENVVSARRRFSNVSDAVSRKLSHTLGQWRGSTVSTVSVREVAAQGRSLCAQYVRNRLKRSGLFSRKCGLQRLRSAANLPGGYVVSEVAPHLLRLGHELERMHPKLYTSVCRQVCVTLTSEKTARTVISRVGHELFKQGETSWGKAVALFCVAGGLACDCVRQGHTDLLPGLLEGAEAVLETELGPWVAAQGGWVLLTHYSPEENDVLCGAGLVLFFLVTLFAALVAVLVFRYWPLT